MTRTENCRSKLGWIEDNCPLERTSIIPIRRASEFCDQHVEISTLSTDAIQPLLKIKNDDVRVVSVVAALKVMIDAGKTPTKRDVVACIHQIGSQEMPQINIDELITAKERQITKTQNTLVTQIRELEALILRKEQEANSGAIVNEPTTIPDTDTVDETSISDGEFFRNKAKNMGTPENTGFDAVRAIITNKAPGMIIA